MWPVDDTDRRPVRGREVEVVAEQGVEIVSSDEIRKETNPEGETPGSQAGIFHRVPTASSKILEEGRDVIVDAMHIEAEHRLRQISIRLQMSGSNT